MPAVGDSKRAIDEYYSEIMMGGHNILSLYNLCEVGVLLLQWLSLEDCFAYEIFRFFRTPSLLLPSSLILLS